MMNRLVIFIAITVIAFSCRNEPARKAALEKPTEFNFSALRSDILPAERMNGQLLYMPVYSNIPYLIDTSMFDMSAFVSIHNTDLKNLITLTQVLYFNQDGKLVDNFLEGNEINIPPLATKNFYIPYEDKSGTGANFLIEWVSDSLVNEPLIESVTLCLKPNNTLSISSKGQVVRQNKAPR